LDLSKYKPEQLARICNGFTFVLNRERQDGSQDSTEFQLTNILRDVSEDAERGRIYLPLRDLEASQVSVELLVLAAQNRAKPETVINLLALEASRARELYASAKELLPLINRDSRAALWVLVTIYRGLLERIITRDYDVFSARVSVPTSKKLMILAQGMGMALRNRMGS